MKSSEQKNSRAICQVSKMHKLGQIAEFTHVVLTWRRTCTVLQDGIDRGPQAQKWVLSRCKEKSRAGGRGVGQPFFPLPTLQSLQTQACERCGVRCSSVGFDGIAPRSIRCLAVSSR